VGGAGVDFASRVALTLPAAERLQKSKTGCHGLWLRYLPRLMPKPIARSKTRKSVSKRFKITGTGKVMRQHASRRHLLSSKSAKRKRHMAKSAEVDKTDTARIKMNMPFA
jgi:large subunit ribosomal protein L35